MNDGTLVKGVILAHGGMAAGLLDAVSRISGITEGALVAVSNQGKSPEVLKAEVESLLEEGPTIVFTDLPSGSCAITARICSGKMREGAVVFSVNLPVLLDFVFHRDLPIHQLVPRLLKKGRENLTSAPEFPSDADHSPSG
jgi:mannose/fructose-specific phosphotransferase system component IIA